jgi:copper chaperone NosL
MKRRMFLGMVTSLVVAAACDRGADEPVDPVWGKQPCAHCAMLVGDRAHAAQASSGGDRFYFDDVGCLVLWLEERGSGGAPRHVWVRDSEAPRWLEARHARYAAGAKTPMDFGFEATSTGGAGWDDVRVAVIAKGKVR